MTTADYAYRSHQRRGFILLEMNVDLGRDGCHQPLPSGSDIHHRVTLPAHRLVGYWMVPRALDIFLTLVARWHMVTWVMERNQSSFQDSSFCTRVRLVGWRLQ